MLKTVQAVTGLIFFAFLILHLLNTWLASVGAGAYDGAQALLRVLYEVPLNEFVVLGAMLLHIVVGITRRLREGPGPTALRARLHRYAGYGLALVIGGHIMAVRGPSWFYDVYPGFAGVAFSIDFAPGYFFPYYLLLATAAFYHGLNGAGIAVARLGSGRPTSGALLKRATLASAGVTLAALLGFAGAWTDVGDPYSSEFALLYQRLLHEVFP